MSKIQSNKLKTQAKEISNEPSSKPIYKNEHFGHIYSDKVPVDCNQKINLVRHTFSVPFMTQFVKEFNDHNLWKVLIGSFCSAILVQNNCNTMAFISFLFLLIMYFQSNRRRRAKAVEYSAKNISKNSEKRRQLLATVSPPQNLNSAKSPDSQCQWINDILAKLWPYINSLAQTQIDKKGFSNNGLDVGNGHTIHFERFTLGDKPPAITAISVNKSTKRKDEISIIVKLIYFGNCLLLFSYKTQVFFKAKAGLKDIYLRGEVIIVLRPLLGMPPFVGGVSVCLLEPPLIDYDGINLGNIADNQMFKKFFVGIISSFLVTPNKIYLPLLKNCDIKRELKLALPIGLCFIEILEAENLPPIRRNKLCIFSCSSNSFCKLRVGGFQLTTNIVNNCSNPYFGRSFWTPVHDLSDLLKIEIFDKDTISGDDLIGSIEFDMSQIKNDKNLNGRDKWLPLGKCRSGSIHFRIAIFDLTVDRKNMDKISLALKDNWFKFCPAILSVYVYYYVRRMSTDERKHLKPVINLKFGEQTYETKPSQPPNRGHYYFEESTHFMCSDLEKDVLEVNLIPHDNNTVITNRSKSLGKCQIPLKHVLDSPKDMTLNQEFPIKKTLKSKQMTQTKELGFVKIFLSVKVCKYRKRLIDNLKTQSTIQTDIQQAICDNSSFTQMIKEPICSIRNTATTLKTIGSTPNAFSTPNDTFINKHFVSIPTDLGKGCSVNVRIKWPERTCLYIEILKVIEIPLNVVDMSYRYSICVGLSLRHEVNETLCGKHKPREGITQTVSNKITTNKVTKNKPKNRKHLTKLHTIWRSLDKYTTCVVFNERLVFKLSPLNHIDNHVLQFFLILHKPKKFFTFAYDSHLVASSIPANLPFVHFKADPIEQLFRLNVHKKFLSS